MSARRENASLKMRMLATALEHLAIAFGLMDTASKIPLNGVHLPAEDSIYEISKAMESVRHSVVSLAMLIEEERKREEERR